jgi:hypothetical protein
MSDYLFLFRSPSSSARLSPEEMQRSLEKWGNWIQGLAKAGTFKGGEPLEEGGKVVTGTRRLVTDGPFAESKEIVGGYLIVTAKNVDEATEISKGCPIFEEGGSVEVRAIRPMQGA